MNNTEWFEGRSVDEQMERCYWRRIAFALFMLAVASLLAIPLTAHADPVFRGQDGDAVITLYNEKCDLKEVSNLPLKATWVERGKTFKGCWASKGGIVIFYFLEDRTVGIAPASAFERIYGA